MSERIVDIGTHNFTQVICMDEPNPKLGNACHNYRIVPVDNTPDKDGNQLKNFANIRFQEGPIKEYSVNGVHNEDLLAIVIDRLQGFQSGDFKCRENSIALTKLEESLHWLNHRTNERNKRGVEGTSVK